MRTKHGVFIRYGVTEIKLSANDLQLISDALDIVNPDTEKQSANARKLAVSFLVLSEYAESVEPKRLKLPERFGPGYPKSESNPGGY